MTLFAVVATFGSVAPSALAYTEWVTSGYIGLDACQDPTSQVLYDFYQNTPYQIWGIYIGGSDMGCSQPNLNAAYIKRITDGPYNYWRLVPIWVGPQDPCHGGGDTFPTNSTDAYNWGTATAQNAYNELQNLGMGNGVPINLDLEAWYSGSGTPSDCISSAKAFVNGWSNFFTNAGVYSSVGGSCPGAGDFPIYESISNPPEHIYGADWDNSSDASYFGSCLPGVWTNERLKQYIGPHNVTEQGVTLNVDSDSADGPVWLWPPS